MDEDNLDGMQARIAALHAPPEVFPPHYGGPGAFFEMRAGFVRLGGLVDDRPADPRDAQIG